MPAVSVMLVNEQDTPVGVADKLAVHRLGRLHRAFSILVFGQPGLLLQQRAENKYHSGGLWSNTCCGHPLPGEPTVAAGRRRLIQAMGLSVELVEAHTLRYRLEIDGLVEHELNHVLVGWTEGMPVPEASEVSSWRWIDPVVLHDDLRMRPSVYTAWLPLIWEGLLRASAVADGWGVGASVFSSLRGLHHSEPGSARP